MEEFKELGIVKISRKNKTVIERQTKRGTVIVNRNEDTFPPRREFKEAWNNLRKAVSDAMFGAGNAFEITLLTSVDFKVCLNQDLGEWDMVGIVVKGGLSANRSVDFSNAFFNEPEVLKFAKKLYVASADYFDGKNAQMEMPFPQLPEGAESMKISTMDGKFGVKITKDGIETIRDSIVPEKPILKQ